MTRQFRLRRYLTGVAASALLAFSMGTPADAQGHLRIGMTANDMPPRCSEWVT